MPYSIQADITASLEALYSDQLTDDMLGQVADADIIIQCVEDADGLIDSYLSTRYTVPLATVHNSVRRASVTLAVYYMHIRRSWTMNDSVKAAKDDLIRWLEAVAAGKADIPGATGAAGVTSSFQTDERRYTIDTLKGF